MELVAYLIDFYLGVNATCPIGNLVGELHWAGGHLVGDLPDSFLRSGQLYTLSRGGTETLSEDCLKLDLENEKVAANGYTQLRPNFLADFVHFISGGFIRHFLFFTNLKNPENMLLFRLKRRSLYKAYISLLFLSYLCLYLAYSISPLISISRYFFCFSFRFLSRG